jgi:hypothetical protein
VHCHGNPLFLFPVKIYKYVKREKLSTKMIVAIAGNFPAISWQQEVVTVDEHKYSPPSILRYIFHIKPNFSKILL